MNKCENCRSERVIEVRDRRTRRVSYDCLTCGYVWRKDDAPQRLYL